MNEEGNPPPKIAPKKFGAEAQRIYKKLNGFEYEKSPVWGYLSSRFSPNISHSELKIMAKFICGLTNLKLDRDASRNNSVLIKWYSDNWKILFPYVERCHFLDKDSKEITSSRTCKTM